MSNLLSIDETCARLGGVSRGFLYALLKREQIPTVVLGKRRLIATETVEALVRNSVATLEPKPRSAA